jgi:hypothetical protein
MLFQPSFAPTYRVPFFVTTALVLIAFVGFALFRTLLIYQNNGRQALLSTWTNEDVEAERKYGTGPLARRKYAHVFALSRRIGGERFSEWILRWLKREDGRKGDEKMTYTYGL